MNYALWKSFRIRSNNRKNPTQAEAYFWQKVRRKQLSRLKINRQFVIEYQDNNAIKEYFIVDFYCHQFKLIIELDGSIHDQQIEYDLAREKVLKAMGYFIPRFTNVDVLKNWQKIEQAIRKFCF